MAQKPEEYLFSSYAGYARRVRRVDWIAYDDHNRYWVGLNGGRDPSLPYRQYVNAGLVNSIDPRIDRLKEWFYGSEDFLKRFLQFAAGEGESRHRRRIRQSALITVEQVIDAAAQEFGVSPNSVLWIPQ